MKFFGKKPTLSSPTFPKQNGFILVEDDAVITEIPTSMTEVLHWLDFERSASSSQLSQLCDPEFVNSFTFDGKTYDFALQLWEYLLTTNIPIREDDVANIWSGVVEDIRNDEWPADQLVYWQKIWELLIADSRIGTIVLTEVLATIVKYMRDADDFYLDESFYDAVKTNPGYEPSMAKQLDKITQMVSDLAD